MLNQSLIVRRALRKAVSPEETGLLSAADSSPDRSAVMRHGVLRGRGLSGTRSALLWDCCCDAVVRIMAAKAMK